MIYRNIPHTTRAENTGRFPWLLILLLTAILFWDSFDLSSSKKGIGDYASSPDDVSAHLAEDSQVRHFAIVLLGIVAIASLSRLENNFRFHIDKPLGCILLGFTAWVFVSPSWAVDPPLTLRRLVTFGILCISSVAVARRLSLRQVVVWTFSCTAIVLFIGILAEVFAGTFRPFSAGYRFAGTLDPNSEGVQCGLLLLSAVAAADKERRWRGFFWASALFGFAFLILSGSRTALAATLLASGVYFAAVFSRRATIVLAFSLSTIGCFFLLSLGGDFHQWFRSASLIRRNNPSDLDSFTGRSVIWENVYYYIRQHPLLGWGYGGFWTPAHSLEMSAQIKSGVANSHSTYVDCFLTLGAVGLFAYTALLFAGIWRALCLYRRLQNSVFAFCCALLVFCVLEGALESYNLAGSIQLFLCMVVLVRLAFMFQHQPRLEFKPTSVST